MIVPLPAVALADNVEEAPAQIAAVPLIEAVGTAFSVTANEAELEHPLASVPTTEYVPAADTVNVEFVELSDHT